MYWWDAGETTENQRHLVRVCYSDFICQIGTSRSCVVVRWLPLALAKLQVMMGRDFRVIVQLEYRIH